MNSANKTQSMMARIIITRFHNLLNLLSTQDI